MPVSVTSAKQGLPELATPSTSVKSGEDFRESLQQVVEASHPNAADETPVRSKTSTNREGAGEQQNPKQAKSKESHTEESAAPSVGSVAVQPQAPVLVTQVVSREYVAVTSVPDSLPTVPGATMVSETGDFAPRRLDVIPGSTTAIAPDKSDKNSGVDAGNAKVSDQGIAAARTAEILAMPSQAEESTDSAAGPSAQEALHREATVNNVAADERVTVARFDRSSALTSNIEIPNVPTQRDQPATSGASDVTANPVDTNDKTPGLGTAAIHQAGSGQLEGTATAAEQFQKLLGLTQVPLAGGDSTGGEGRKTAIHKAGSADGRASGQEKPDGSQVQRDPAHGENNHDQAESGTPAPNRVPSANGGHLQVDGFAAALHISPSGDGAGGDRNGVRFNRASDTTSSTESHESASAPGRDATEGYVPGGGSLPVVVNTARLVQRIQESEINLNVRSADFGNVAIHTAISHERVSSQISLEHIDLGRAIASEIQALQSKLSHEHGMEASIEVQQQGQSFSGNGGQPQQQTWRQQPAVPNMVAQEPSLTAILPAAVLDDGRLDIRV